MSRYASEVKKLKKLVAAETHEHAFFIPKDAKDEKRLIKSVKSDNTTIGILRIYDW